MSSAINHANYITSKFSTVRLIVREFDRAGLRMSKAELQAVARDRGLDASGTRSALCFRIARAACGE